MPPRKNKNANNGMSKRQATRRPNPIANLNSGTFGFTENKVRQGIPFTRRERGMVLLGTVTARESSNSEVFEISPVSLAPTRFGALLRLYDRIKYNKMHIDFKSSLPAITPGTCRFYPEIEVDSLMTYKDFTTFMDNYGAVSNTISKNVAFDVPLLEERDRPVHYTRPTGDARFWMPAKIYAYCSGTGLDIGAEVGNLYLTYDVTMMIPSSPGSTYEFKDTTIRRLKASAAFDGTTAQIYDTENFVDFRDSTDGEVDMESGTTIHAIYDPDNDDEAKLSCKQGELSKGAHLVMQPATAAYNDTADTIIETPYTHVMGVLKTLAGDLVTYAATAAAQSVALKLAYALFA